MIDFKPFEELDRNIYESYFFAETEQCCALSFGNLNMWGEHWYCIIHNQLLVLSKYNDKYMYHFPLGSGDKKAALECLIEDAKEREITLLITSITQDNAKELETLFPDTFDIRFRRDSFDYVYEIDKLADLKGRKYHRKRNHYNNFCKRMPDFYVEPVSAENIEDAKEFITKWYADRLAQSPENDYNSEQLALQKCYQNYERLNLESLLLYHDGNILAFTMGSRISPNTFDVHFEKARWDVEGAYTAINSEFAKYIRSKYPEVEFLNREEDMGLEGLRKAKESYFPHHMVEKAIATLKDPFFLDKLHISQPLTSQIEQLRQLWKDTFGDSDAFLDIFQETAFSPERCRCATLNDTVVAALYWFDCEFEGQPIAYVYAIATAEEYRGRGVCHALMENTHEHLTAHGYAGAILSPASDKLFEFYKEIGYETCAYNSELIFKEDALYAFEEKEIALRKIAKEEFVELRRNFLPKNAVLQEKENLSFLEKQADFFTGKNFLLTAKKEQAHLYGIEFLGDTSAIPSILKSMKCKSGHFRMIGDEKPVAMYLPLQDTGNMPNYIGFIFD